MAHDRSSVASSSNPETQTAASIETDRQRVDLLSKLINIMLRQLRVRYELKLTDLLRAYVFSCLSWGRH